MTVNGAYVDNLFSLQLFFLNTVCYNEFTWFVRDHVVVKLEAHGSSLGFVRTSLRPQNTHGKDVDSGRTAKLPTHR